MTFVRVALPAIHERLGLKSTQFQAKAMLSLATSSLWPTCAHSHYFMKRIRATES